MSIKKYLENFYNSLIVEQPEKNDSSLIVKELCKLYSEERSKGKSSKSILEMLDKILTKRNQNPDKIINWFLSDDTNSTVQLILGHCYSYGRWVEKDLYKGFNYYKKSDEMGDHNGTFSLGYCYSNGITVKIDKHKAFYYYKKSGDMGNIIGIYNTGECYLNGTGVKKDETKAFEYFMRSAEKGHMQGMIDVANCYRNGIGVSRDIQRANHWYQKERNTKKSKSLLDKQKIDDSLKTILEDERYQLSWIPYNEFQDIHKIGKGGFATVFKAYWHDKCRNNWSWIALKLIHGSNENIDNFLQEFRLYCDIGYENPSFLQCHGISRHPNGEYLIVMKFAKKLSLRDNLRDVSRMEWKKKLNLLHCIASDLESIHSQELIHKDLHSGNILQDQLHCAYITDLGLTSEKKLGNKIIGILPYVAPEILQGQEFTQAADIYGLGIIMTEITTGIKAFDGESFDTKLSVKICKGERPEFAPGTPDCYIKLAKRCMDVDQKKRPTATVINHSIGYWLDQMDQDDKNYFKKQFSNADKVKPEPIEPKHPSSMYTNNLSR